MRSASGLKEVIRPSPSVVSSPLIRLSTVRWWRLRRRWRSLVRRSSASPVRRSSAASTLASAATSTRAPACTAQRVNSAGTGPLTAPSPPASRAVTSTTP